MSPALPLSRRAFAALPALAATPALGQTLVETVQRARLVNGMDVVVLPDTRVPVVTHMLWYKVGSADEERGKTGLAHFLEHLMFKGTGRHAAGVFSRAVRDAGGSENAFTSFDYTGYFQRVAKERLGEMMAFEADRMTGLVLTDAVVDPERDVVMEERKSSIDNSPAARLSEQAGFRLWGEGHPYAHPIIGWMDDIRGLTREDALAFYRRWYAPNNAILVVAGDTDIDQVLAAAESSYARLQANPGLPRRARPAGPRRATPDRVRLADARVAQPALTKSWIVPSYATAAPGEAEAMDLLAQIAGASPNGPVFRGLVSQGQLAASAGAFYSGGALGQGRFGLSASPRPGVTFERVEAAMREAVRPLAENGPSQVELDRAKTRMVAASIFAQDSQSSMARMYGAALTSGSTTDDLAAWPNRIRAVGAEAVQAAARRVFDFEAALTSELVRA